MIKFLTIDTETGGLNPNYHSLFEATFSFNTLEIDKETNTYKATEISQLYIKVKEEPLVYNNRAIEINKIDVLNWAGCSPQKTSEIIDEYLNKIYEETKEAITIMGHNIAFDLSFLKRLPSYKEKHCTDYFSHRVIDTSSIGRMVSLVLDTPIDLSKSNHLFDFFNLPYINRHSSKVDVANTTDAFVAMLNQLYPQSILSKYP